MKISPTPEPLGPFVKGMLRLTLLIAASCACAADFLSIWALDQEPAAGGLIPLVALPFIVGLREHTGTVKAELMRLLPLLLIVGVDVALHAYRLIHRLTF